MTIDRNVSSRYSSTARSIVLMLAAAVVAGLMISCASVRNPPGTVTAQFFQNPDRVWNGLLISLDALGYEVTSSNRDEGVMHAAAQAGDASAIALEINQVMYTQDQVKVFVRGVAGNSSPAPRQEDLEKAAQDFVTVLKRKLGG